jgi:hypothetical protein
MSRILSGLAALTALALLSFATPVHAAPKPSGISKAEQVNLSARRYHRRYYYRRYWAPRRYYYGPYPYYGYPYYYPYYRPYYYRPYFYRPYPFFPFAPWW